MNRQNTIVDQESMVGKKFGRLIVESAAPSRHKRAYWNCRCECGNACVAMGKYLRQNKKQSCGCLFKENRLWLSAKGVQARQEHRLPPGEAAFNLLFATYRSSAAQKGLKFELMKEDFKCLTKQTCFYCGKEPFSVCKPDLNGGYLYNGIDRRDNRQGYIQGNVVACCKFCNWMKNVFNEFQFLSHVSLIYEYQRTK